SVIDTGGYAGATYPPRCSSDCEIRNAAHDAPSASGELRPATTAALAASTPSRRRGAGNVVPVIPVQASDVIGAAPATTAARAPNTTPASPIWTTSSSPRNTASVWLSDAASALIPTMRTHIDATAIMAPRWVRSFVHSDRSVALTVEPAA